MMLSFDFITPTFLTSLVHLVGFALGMGAAFTSDAIFFSSIRDKRVSKTELRFLELGSQMVWLGLFVLLLSGGGLLWLDYERLSISHKFWAKMTIVGILSVNGLVFHFFHVPWMANFMGKQFHRTKSYPQRKVAIVLSGVVSTVSWSAALTLGTLRNLSWDYVSILMVYIAVLLSAAVIALFLKDKLLP